MDLVWEDVRRSISAVMNPNVFLEPGDHVLEATILKEILSRIKPKRRFKVWWEVTLIDQQSGGRSIHNKAVIQLRRKFWDFFNYWLYHDLSDCFVEGFVQVNFINGCVQIYKYDGPCRKIIPLGDPNSFSDIGNEILDQTIDWQWRSHKNPPQRVNKPC